MTITADNGKDKAQASFSEFAFANVFGIISQKITTQIVIIKVEIPTPLLPKAFVSTTVATDVAAMLAMLFAIKIAVNALSNFSEILSARLADLLPLSARLKRRILLTLEKDVSIAEKNAETTSSSMTGNISDIISISRLLP
jgi:hypothetical protein